MKRFKAKYKRLTSGAIETTMTVYHVSKAIGRVIYVGDCGATQRTMESISKSIYRNAGYDD